MKKKLYRSTAILGFWAFAAFQPFTAVAQAGEFSGPLRVGPSARYFTDEGGKPFFWLGDTVWQLFTSYTPEEALSLLDNRRAKGFTVIQAVLCAWPGPACGANTSGERPFLDGNPAKPNDVYFAHVDSIVDAAAARGIILALLPVWGNNYVSGRATGGTTLVDAGNARAYALYLGNRYAGKPNIIWLLGGDTPVYDKAAVYQELAAGLRETDAQRKLIGYHPSSNDSWPDWSIGATSAPSMNPYGVPESNLDFNMAESYKWYDKIPLLVSHMYGSAPAKPAIMGEGSYEGGPVDTRCCAEYAAVSPWDIRKQAYWSYLAGGSYTYGHEAIWSHGESPAGGAWQTGLDAPGAKAMELVKNFFTTRDWWNLIPDNSIFVDGAGSGIWQRAAARHLSGGSAVVYLANSSPVQLDLGKLALSGGVKATWMDPRNGHRIEGGVFGRGIQRLTPPAGFEDAILTLGAADDEGTHSLAAGITDLVPSERGY